MLFSNRRRCYAASEAQDLAKETQYWDPLTIWRDHSHMLDHAFQVPLQPLQDNLELQTYETFERDSPKYTAYEEAMHDALLDKVPQSEAASRTIVLMVRFCPPNSEQWSCTMPC